VIYRNEMSSGSGLSELGVAKSASCSPSCTICGERTVKHFSKELNGMTVDYFLCLTCEHLTAGDISAAPCYDGGEYFRDIDTGWEDRNQTVLRYIKFFVQLPGFSLPARSAIFDFGCGTGRLVGDLHRAGFEAWGFEPYPESAALSERLFRDWEEARRTLRHVDLITCIEVLEHFRNPDEFMQRVSQVLAPSGYLLISTGIYNSGFHDEGWYYLNPAAGHVSIFSEKSFRILLERYRFEPVLRASNIAWLFRDVTSRRRSVAERVYFALSQLRTKGKFQVVSLARKFLGADWRPPGFVRRLWGNL